MVVRFGALGDMVLMSVAIRRIAERYGSPVDVLGSGEWTRPLLEGQRGVGDLYLLRSHNSPYWLAPEQWRLVRALRQRGAGPTWSFESHSESDRCLLKRAGWQDQHLLTLDQLPDIAGEHFCDHWRRFAQLDPVATDLPSATSLPAQESPAYPQLTVSPEIRALSLPWLQSLGVQGHGYILVQPGNKRTMRRLDRRRASNTKYWPEEHWAAVLQGLRALHGEHALLLLGIGPEAQINDEILALARVGNAYNLAREMSVPRLMALCVAALGMISVDTGPAHVAAAVGCPVLTLFDSPAKRTMYTPRGPGAPVACLVGGSDVAPSMLGITPEAVLASWREMGLAQTRSRQSA